MHRFFIPPAWIDQNSIAIRGKLLHQLRDVLRLRAGEHIIVLDNSGWEYEVEIEKIDKFDLLGTVMSKRLVAEPATKVILYQALLKSNKFEFVLQKGTELGIEGFVPIICKRSVPREVANIEHRLARWQRVIQEAAEQSGRGKLPFLSSLTPFEQACNSINGLSLLAWEAERRKGLKAALQSHIKQGANTFLTINLFIGPEGGFTFEEVEFARGFGVLTISLGNRLLRAETAGLVSAAAIFYECGELGSL